MPPLLFRPARSPSSRLRGFTLLELLIGVSLIAILAALAFPSYREFSVRMTVSDTTNALVHALSLARAEAVKRGVNVAVEANAGGWSSGWEVRPEDSAEVLLSHGALADSYSLAGKATGGGDDNRVVFRGMGSLSGSTSFDFSICRPSHSPGNEQSRWIAVQGSGVVTSRRDTTASPAGGCG